MNLNRTALSVLIAVTAICGVSIAAENTDGVKMRVGVHEKPPFAMKDADGNWMGLGVLLWRSVAERMNVTYEFIELPYERLIPSIEDGSTDLIVGELHVDPEIEKRVTFTQPYISTALGVAVRDSRGITDWLEAAAAFLNWSLLKIVGLVILGLILFSLLIWLAERIILKSDAFGGKHLEGIGWAMWFSAATMTSVGYGDKTPSTWLGRLLAFVWMLVGLIILAAFSGTVASSISEMRYAERITAPQDLKARKVGALDDGDAERALKQVGARVFPFEEILDGLEAVRARKLEAFIADRVSIAYLIQHTPVTEVRLNNVRFAERSIAMVVPRQSERLEEINVALLETTSNPRWSEALSYWLGPASPRVYTSTPVKR